MSEELGPDFEKMSAEGIAEVVEAINEFLSAHPWTVLSQIAGLQIEKESVEEKLINRRPPLEISSNAEFIPVDEYLGMYKPQAKRIILFEPGITAAADLLKCETDDLQHVVRYHEWAHAILHLGLDKSRHQCEFKDYNRIDERVHESLAQLLACRAIKQNICESRNARVQTKWKRIGDVFTKLEVRQPPQYRSWRQFQELPIVFLQEILVLIRKQVRFADWEGLSACVHAKP